MNCNHRDRLFSYMRPLLDINTFSKQVYVRVLAYLKQLKLVYVSVLEFDVLFKYVIKFWSRNLWAYTMSDSQINICFNLQTIQSMQNCNNWYKDVSKFFNKMLVHLGLAFHTHAIVIFSCWEMLVCLSFDTCASLRHFKYFMWLCDHSVSVF